MTEDDELIAELGKEYVDDFKNLDRKDGAIITNDKFVAFMKKHIPSAFPSKEFLSKVKVTGFSVDYKMRDSNDI